MPSAIVTATTAFHIGLGFAVFCVGLGLGVFRERLWDRRGAEPTCRVEVEEYADPWASLPPKWRPPVAESHLGKEHLGERRRAA